MPSNNYTRQKAAEIQDNLTINASIFNAEYNQIQLAFSYSGTGETGHTHSGAAGEGGAIGKIGNQDFSKSLEISTNDWVFTGSSVQPAADNTTDLGVSGKGWKDVYVSGTVTANGLTLGDNEKIQIGDTQDLELLHDGTNSYVQDAGDGGLILNTTSGNGVFINSATESMGAFHSNGAVNLYYDNAEKFATTDTGIDVTGTVTAEGLTLGDNEKIQIGASQDLELFHDGSNSYIKNAGAGNLLILANDLRIKNAAGNEDMLQVDQNGAVKLSHDGVTKLTTANTGIDVTGTITADAIKFTTDPTDDAKIFTEVTGTTTALVIQSKDDADDSIVLRSNNTGVGEVDVLVATKTGIDVTGTVTADGVNLGNNEKITFGGTTSPNLEMYETAGGTGLIVQNGSGDLVIKGQIGSLQNDADSSLLQWAANDVALYWRGTNSGQRLVTTETGIDVTGTVTADGVALGNNEKITFGAEASGKLEIYEGTDGNAYVEQTGNGDLYIKGQNGYLRSDSVDVASWGSLDIGLKYNGSDRLLTTSAGIDVTGTTNTDNLTINGAQGSDGQVLTSTGSGVAWEDAAAGGGGSVTAVTGTAPIASSGGTAPAISISQASGSTDGYLSSTDWTTFNNKGAGTLTGVTEGAAIDINTNNASSPTISVDLSELTVETDDLVGSTDHLVYLDNGNQKKILANNVNLSAFDNDVGWTNNTGTVTNVSGGTGITVSSGSTTPTVSITSNSIGATQLNVSGNGAATEFLRSDGDGTFTWAIPADTDTTYTADNTTINLTGTQFSVEDNGIGATQLNVSGNGSATQFLRSDGDGTFTWATPTDTNTTYTAGTGLSLTGADFNLSLNELSTTTASATSYLVLSGTPGNKTLLGDIGNHLFEQEVQELEGFGPLGRRANSIKVIDTSGGDKTVSWNTSVEGAYYTVHAIGANDINYAIPSGTTVYITGPSGLITRTSGTVTIKGGSSCTVTAYGSSETFIYAGNNVTYS